MANVFEVVFVLFFTFCLTTVITENNHFMLTSLKYESLVHNMKEKYILDKNETVQVWVKVVPFPWQDNRLIPGITDPFLLESNASCVEEVVSRGVVTRNVTAQITQPLRKANESSLDDKTGNATFHIGIFEGTGDETLRVETQIVVGCPPGRNMKVYKDEENCPVFENHTFTIPSGHYRSDLTSSSQATTPKTVQYDFKSFGCPLEASYYNVLKPMLQLYENGTFLRNVSANYVVFELNGRIDFSYSASMAQQNDDFDYVVDNPLYRHIVFMRISPKSCTSRHPINSRYESKNTRHKVKVGCLREAQIFEKMIDENLSDVRLAWTARNYKSCFISELEQNANLDQRYEILNQSGLSALTWHSEGVYLFTATVVDPEYSFCNLTAMFAVHVSGVESGRDELIPFLVLATSVFGLCSVIFIVFFTTCTVRKN